MFSCKASVCFDGGRGEISFTSGVGPTVGNNENIT